MEAKRTPDARFEDLADFAYEPNYVDVDDGEGGTLRMAYIDEGERDAPPVLMLHGEPTWSYLYRKMIPIFVEAGFRAVAPDLIGFGRSDKPTRRDDYTYGRYVDWTGQFVEEAGLEDIHLVCQDWGGLIGLRLVAEMPERFSRVVAANTFLPTGDEPIPDAFFKWRELSQSMDDLDPAMVVDLGTVGEVSAEALEAYRAPFPDASYKAAAHVFPMLVPTSSDDPAAEANRAAWVQLQQLDKPFLTLFGDSDPIMRGADVLFQEAVPGTKGQPHATLEQAGHFIQEDQGEELARRAVDFFQG
ncbi:MAG: haloalkane dehalogenase [Persicimonas sp.]